MQKLVQKFVARSRVGIFRNERTRSIPVDPKLMFWCVLFYWVHCGPFGCVMKLSAKRAELVQKFVPRSRVRIFCNEHTRSTPLDPKQMFWCVSFYLGAFRTVWLPNESRCKTGRTSAKVRARSRVGIFRAKLTFLCVSYYSGAFRTVWLPYGTRCKLGRTSAKGCATKSRRNF